MAKDTNNGLIVYLITFCLSFLFSISKINNAWPKDNHPVQDLIKNLKDQNGGVRWQAHSQTLNSLKSLLLFH